jgi:hypothetical protein
VVLILKLRKNLRHGGKIYLRTEGSQRVIANMKFQTREAAVDACIIEINGLLDKGQSGGGSE